VEDRISEHEHIIEIKKKTIEILTNPRAVKGICKNSATPSKDKLKDHGH
jgi:hypothetical protein